jgi:hypothetical protein
VAAYVRANLWRDWWAQATGVDLATASAEPPACDILVDLIEIEMGFRRRR